MVVVDSYLTAVCLCVLTMLCWGSWANTQKLAGKTWPFQLFYWDYSVGVVLFALLLAFTAGSFGPTGRAFLADLHQATPRWLASAFAGGVIFNLSNILLVAAIDIAGMAVAFPVGVGLALVLGVITTYLATHLGNVANLSSGVACIVAAILLDAIAYKRMASVAPAHSSRGLTLAIAAGVLMGTFYSLVARAMADVDPLSHTLEPFKLTPYSALVLFSFGVFLSNFIWNSLAMAKPFRGPRVTYAEYLSRGSARLHAVGILGGLIWNAGMGLNILASGVAGPALSYGLGQGATLVGAFWGVFVWREFKGAPRGTGWLLAAMFGFYALGIAILISSKL